MNKNQKTFSKANDDDDILSNGSLPIAVDSKVQNTFTIPLDEPIAGPSYYRDAVKAIQDANEGDVVKFQINSPGGRMDGCASILHAIASTDATTVAEIIGDCYSAASLIALSCDIVQVGEEANLLAHSARWGYAGKGNDVLGHTIHTKKISDNTLRRAYHNFLSPTEIEEVIQGRELYLDADEICERLAQREELSQQEEEDWSDPESYTEEQLQAIEQVLETTPVPAKKTSKRKKS